MSKKKENPVLVEGEKKIKRNEKCVCWLAGWSSNTSESYKGDGATNVVKFEKSFKLKLFRAVWTRFFVFLSFQF